MSLDRVQIIDDFLDPHDQRLVWDLLRTPGWAFGAFSDSSAAGSRYFYKHYAGYVKDGAEPRTSRQIEEELAAYPLLVSVWEKLKMGPFRGHALARCYANGMPAGAEGGLHVDSNIDTHFTAIYYPHPDWHHSLGGETLFFNRDGTDLVAAVYAKPNRVVVFPGTIPHGARPMSTKSSKLRITLVFKSGPA